MIVYFSGTGNSRYCAKMLADKLEDELLDTFHFIRDGIALELTSTKPWIFVAPTYSWRLPRVFEAILRSGYFSGSRDAYFVMTCAGDNGSAAPYNRALCQQIGLRYRGNPLRGHAGKLYCHVLHPRSGAVQEVDRRLSVRPGQGHPLYPGRRGLSSSEGRCTGSSEVRNCQHAVLSLFCQIFSVFCIRCLYLLRQM